MLRDAFILGDCMDPERGLPSLPDKSVGHVITDPPFSDHVHAGNRRGWETAADGTRRPTREMPMAFGAFTEDDVERHAREYVRVSAGWVLVFCALEQIGLWQHYLEAAGAKRRNTSIVTGRSQIDPQRVAEMVRVLRGAGFTDHEILAALRADDDVLIWTKSNCAPKFQGDGPANAAEAIVAMWAGTGPSRWNAGGSYGHYHYPVDNAARVERRHETQKPDPLMRQILLDFTLPGDLVCDPCAGGGSTLVVAKQLGRHWLGYELGATEEGLRAWELGSEEIEQARVLSPEMLRHFHRARKARAYAGLAPKPTAIATQIDLGFERRPRRKARSLDDL